MVLTDKEIRKLVQEANVLVSLCENICLPSNVTAHLRPKTRYTRLGLLVSDQHCNSTRSEERRVGKEC